LFTAQTPTLESDWILALYISEPTCIRDEPHRKDDKLLRLPDGEVDTRPCLGPHSPTRPLRKHSGAGI